MAENMIAVCLRSRKSNRQKIRGGGGGLAGGAADLLVLAGARYDGGGVFEGVKWF